MSQLFPGKDVVIAASCVATAKSIKPVREWAAMFTGAEIFRRRLDADFVARSEAYATAALGALGQALS